MTDVLERFCDECGVVDRVSMDELVTTEQHPWRRKWYAVALMKDGKLCRKHFCTECKKVAKPDLDALLGSDQTAPPEPPIEAPPPVARPKRRPAKKPQPRPEPKPKPDKWLL